MAPPRTRAQAEASTEQQKTAREGEAERVEQEQQEEATAEERREREQARATDLKSVPEGALPPTERATRSGEAAYSRDYLLSNAIPLTGHESHVLVGALYGNDQEYMTPTEAKSLVERWLDSEDATGKG